MFCPLPSPSQERCISASIYASVCVESYTIECGMHATFSQARHPPSGCAAGASLAHRRPSPSPSPPLSAARLPRLLNQSEKETLSLFTTQTNKQTGSKHYWVGMQPKKRRCGCARKATLCLKVRANANRILFCLRRWAQAQGARAARGGRKCSAAKAPTAFPRRRWQRRRPTRHHLM
jgi:hypothetical protein